MNLSLPRRLSLRFSVLGTSALAGSAFGLVLLAMALPAQCPPPGGPPPAGWTPAGPPLGQNAVAPPPAPSGPTTGQPAGPSGPTPTAPTTGGPAAPYAPPPTGGSGPITGAPPAPRAAAVAAKTGARGMPLTFERQATAKDRLKVDWVFPVVKPRSEPHTAPAGALPLADALAVLWEGGDDRPLLVLRECMLCQGSDDALLNRSLGNDRTQLLTKWFRTVRLPAHVSEPGHPLHNVFAGFDFKDGAPHFFLLAHPGAKPVAFSGRQTQGELWRGMCDVIGERYAKDPQRAVKDWLAQLDHFDMLDARRLRLEEQLGEVRAEEGPDSAKAKKIIADLQHNAEERVEALAREHNIRDLGLLAMPRTKVASSSSGD